MCKISVYQYTCKHHIQHVWSACRGQVKVTKDSATAACQQSPSLYLKASHACGSCSRLEAEQTLRHNLSLALSKITNNTSSSSEEEGIQALLAHIATQIPTTNWRPLPSPVYSRKPSQKPAQTRRRHSLLRHEVRAEDACGPEAWEDNVVLPAYEAVDDGWNWEWTSGTKSLADEVAEDEEVRRKEGIVEGGTGDEDDDEEGAGEGDGENDGKGDGEPALEEPSMEMPAVEDPAVEKPTKKGPVAEGPTMDDCGVRYWFRQHRSIGPGRKVGFRNWELVVVQAN